MLLTVRIKLAITVKRRGFGFACGTVMNAFTDIYQALETHDHAGRKVDAVEDIGFVVFTPEDAIYLLFGRTIGKGYRGLVFSIFLFGNLLPGVHVVLVEGNVELTIVGVLIDKAVDAVLDISTTRSVEIIADSYIVVGNA